MCQRHITPDPTATAPLWLDPEPKRTRDERDALIVFAIRAMNSIKWPTNTTTASLSDAARSAANHLAGIGHDFEAFATWLEQQPKANQ